MMKSSRESRRTIQYWGRNAILAMHATILALLGFDHERLTYRYNGRDFRLTDNYGNVVREIIA